MKSVDIRRPLSGVRVVELPGLAPVPFCGQILADFGADVLLIEKINNATNEDVLRRGKRTIRVDLRSQSDIDVVRDICKQADVLLDPFRPGVLEQIGLDPVHLMQANPKLIIAMISSYGQDGPYYSKAGHDINFIALSGLMPTVCGKSHWPPANLLGDFAGGSLTTAFAICAALFRRQRDGVGCVIDCAMDEGVAYLGSFVAQNIASPLLFNDNFSVFSGNCPIYRTYKTKDDKFIAVGALEEKFHRNLFTALGLDPDDAIAEMFAEPIELTRRLEKIFVTKTQTEWFDVFHETDACVSPVLDMRNVGDFEQHRYRNFFMATADNKSKESPVWIPGPAPRILTAEEFRLLQERRRIHHSKL